MRHKRGKARKLLFWALVIFGTSYYFFWAKDAAYAARGYEAVGGEWLLWLLPGLLWSYIRTGREMREEWKRERNEGDAERGV